MSNRFQELDQKRQTTGLDATESKEFEILFNAANDPQVVAAKNENQRLVLQAQRDFAFQQIFATVVNSHQAVDNEANRLEITSWVHPGEQINNPQEWFVRVLKESPSLGGKLSWEKYLTPTQKKAQEAKDTHQRREQALAKCRQHDLSECESNLNILMNHDGTIAWFPMGSVLLTDEEGEIPLVAATQAELQKYADEKEAARIEHLEGLAQTNNITELRRIAKQDAERKQQSLEITRQQRLEQEVATQYFRDTQAGYRSPLPQVYDAVAIRKFDAQKMREVMSRFGASRITARLYGLTEVPDGNGGTIRFD